MKTTFFLKNLHLIVSALIVIPVAFAYGIIPEKVLPFWILKLKPKFAVFRAIMGLYLAFSVF